MKKWIVLMLTLVLIFSMTACGEAQESSVAGKVEPSAEPTEASEKPVSMGRLEGGTYINEYTGYACALDSNWAFYTAEELQELPENVQELLADTEIGDNMEGIAQFTDMMAENVEELVTVNVMYTKLGMQERLVYAVMSDEQIIDEVFIQKTDRHSLCPGGYGCRVDGKGDDQLPGPGADSYENSVQCRRSCPTYAAGI